MCAAGDSSRDVRSPSFIDTQWMPAKVPLWGNSKPTLPSHLRRTGVRTGRHGRHNCPQAPLRRTFTGLHPYSSPGNPLYSRPSTVLCGALGSAVLA
eukprot:7376627-Prymnesium_polylepis.1